MRHSGWHTQTRLLSRRHNNGILMETSSPRSTTMCSPSTRAETLFPQTFSGRLLHSLEQRGQALTAATAAKASQGPLGVADGALFSNENEAVMDVEVRRWWRLAGKGRRQERGCAGRE